MGNKPVLAVVLIAVIVACIAFMVYGSGKKSGPKPSGAALERDLICLSCEKPFKATLSEADWLPMVMQGKDVAKKVKCSACGKDEGVAATKCPSCGTLVSGGMRDPASKPAVCPKCKKPIISRPGPGGPMGGPAANRPAVPPGATAK
jgi:hypothetical protein